MTNLVSTLRTQLVGRHTLVSELTTNGSGVIALAAQKLDPISVGDRPAVVSAAFERYRILRIDLHWRSALASTISGALTLGVHDDAVATNAPSTPDGILNFRTSRTNDVWKDFTLSYSPVDASKWYYINPDTVGDPRFVTQAVLYYMSDTLRVFGLDSTGAFAQAPFESFVAGNIVIEYHYLFDGATNVAD